MFHTKRKKQSNNNKTEPHCLRESKCCTLHLQMMARRQNSLTLNYVSMVSNKKTRKAEITTNNNKI